MADSLYKIRIDMGAFSGITQEVLSRSEPVIRAALERVADATAMRWRSAVDGAKLWSGEKAAYRASIKWEMVGPLKAEVSSDYRYAQEIEEGRPARDLKRMLQTSLKVRMSKRGERYLIIPFRHNTPGNEAHAPAMPPDVHAIAETMVSSAVTGQTWRSSGTGAWGLNKKPLMVPKAQYKWGDSLPSGLAPKLQPHHKTDPHAGMVRMDTSGPKGRSSSYLTFRVMCEGSQGWVVPPKPGVYLARSVAQEMQPLAEQAIGAAISRSLAPSRNK